MQAVSQKNKKKALFWFLAPMILLVAVLMMYSISSFILSSLDPSAVAPSEIATSTATEGVVSEPTGRLVVNIVKIVLGLLGLISLICIPIGLILGIVYLNRREEVSGEVYDPRSGKGNASEIPAEIKGWNWGAAGLGVIWGISNSVWLCLVSFVPMVGWFWWIIMGIKGNEWAWSSQPWKSVEEFKAHQAKWNTWGLVMFIFSIFIVMTYVYLIATQPEVASELGS